MALGDTVCSTPQSRDAEDQKHRGLGFNNRAGMVGRKRVCISNDLEVLSLNSPTNLYFATRVNKPRARKSRLESLPEDVLVRVLCGVSHEDLKQLIHVSKSVRDATLIAKQLHFAFSTPSKRISGVRCLSNSEEESSCDLDAPDAPRRARASMIVAKKLADISVALFANWEEA